MKYDVIIGLEIHAELKTKSKMFCACDNQSEGREPNSLVCPVCLGHPGTLPVPNRQAIEWTVLLGMALGGEINTQSKFDRKNYFYPDLPKGYQISQYDLPLVRGGQLEIAGRPIAITRVHLEEDTGKLYHPAKSASSLLDFNRAGTPLVEMVTEPVIADAAEAKKFCQHYQQILRYLDISNADMEKGEMRCEANISLQKPATWDYRPQEGIVPKKGLRLNAKVEIKNINSFRAVEKAIKFEIKRQTDALDSGEKIKPETRGWNDSRGETYRQRTKETSADYRYFPEPDIPPLVFTPEYLEKLRTKLIELPLAKARRFQEQYSFAPADAEIIIADRHLADFTENTMSELRAWINSTGDNWERQKKKLAKTMANWLISELFKYLNKDKKSIREIKITPENFAELILLIYQGKVNSTAGQQILAVMYEQSGDPTDIMSDLGLEQIDDEAALAAIIQDILKKNEAQADQYRAGKNNVLQYLIGQTMAATKGKANPKIIEKILIKFLS